MRFRSWAFTALALVPATAYLTDAPPASAAPTLTCTTYPACVANLQNNHTKACNEARQENKNAACPPLTSQYIAGICGPAPNCTPVSGLLRPKFIVTNVIYAPPGSANKGGGSSVDYGSSSTTGVTTAVSSSFKSDYSLTSTLSLDGPEAFGISLASEEFKITTSTSSTTQTDNTLDVKKTVGSDIKVPGPGTDGIDHSYDEIWVLLNPVVLVTAVGTSAQWVVGMDSHTVPQYATVGWLKNPSTMPQNVAQAFASAGLTTADYATMLARDPFASTRQIVAPPLAPQAPPDPTRYTLVDTFTYEANASGPTQQYSLKNDSTVTQKTTNTDTYSVGMSITATAGFADWIKLSLQASGTWTWTDSSSSSNSQDQSQSATATVASPSPGYTTGATDIQVYWDGIYGTFLFVPYNASNPTVTGTVMSAMNRPVASADVLVTVGGRRIHAFTDSHGVYRVSGLPAGPAQLSYGGKTLSATLGSTTSKVDFAAATMRR